jgi:hypothetical protein
MSFIVVTLAVSGVFGSAAFNYATVSGRTTTLTVVTDANAYVSIAGQDATYSCYISTSNGKITIDFANACNSGGGTGFNPGTVAYFENLLVITNKGDRDWAAFWANSSDPLLTINMTYSTDSSMTTSSTFAQNAEFASSVPIGASVYLGIKADGTTKDTSSGAWAPTISFAARSTS